MTTKHPEMTKLLEAIEKLGWEEAILLSNNIDVVQFLKLRNAYYTAKSRLFSYIIKHGEVNEDRNEGPRTNKT